MDKVTLWSLKTQEEIIADINKVIKDSGLEALVNPKFKAVDFDDLPKPIEACRPESVGKKKAQWKQEKQFYKRK